MQQVAVALISISAIVFVLQILFLKKKYRTTYPLTENTNLSITILIATRNGADRLPALLDCLQKMQYPRDRFEVILVDDHSTDNTAEVISQFSKNTNISVRYIKAGEKELPAKKGALLIGMQYAAYDYVAVTDDDCTPPQTWLQSISTAFENGFDLFVGPAPFFESRGIANLLSRYEQLHASLLMLSMAEAGYPYTATARNFAFSKAAYQKSGGYTVTDKRTSGDDDLLLQEAVKNNLHIYYSTNKQDCVFSTSADVLPQYFKQKARHVSTSHVYTFTIQLMLSIYHSVHLLSLGSFVFYSFSPFFIIPTFCKLFFEIYLVKKYQNEFNYTFSLSELFLASILRECFIPIHFLRSLYWNKSW